MIREDFSKEVTMSRHPEDEKESVMQQGAGEPVWNDLGEGVRNAKACSKTGKGQSSQSVYGEEEGRSEKHPDARSQWGQARAWDCI